MLSTKPRMNFFMHNVFSVNISALCTWPRISPFSNSETHPWLFLLSTQVHQHPAVSCFFDLGLDSNLCSVVMLYFNNFFHWKQLPDSSSNTLPSVLAPAYALGILVPAVSCTVAVTLVHTLSLLNSLTEKPIFFPFCIPSPLHSVWHLIRIWMNINWTTNKYSERVPCFQ